MEEALCADRLPLLRGERCAHWVDQILRGEIDLLRRL
jgi:hypothetical protein